MKELLKKYFNKYGISADDDKLNEFCEYYNIVIEENQKFNLTAITEKNDFALKHFLDCVIPASLIKDGAKLLDIGAGAGFPSIPLKILRPDLNITMIDSLNKRVNFLNETVQKLNLSNISAIHTRAEDYAAKNREQFDVVIARAVAGLNTLSEYCLPFVKIGGVFIAMKGSSYGQELDEANGAINILGGRIKDIKLTQIDEMEGERANIVVEKVSATPAKYPRGKNLPRLKPLK